MSTTSDPHFYDRFHPAPQLVMSVDAETDGLYGPSFAIAATLRYGGHEIARFEARIPDALVNNEWCRTNVLPRLMAPVTDTSSVEMEEAFWSWWMAHREGATVIAHFASPVESGLFRRCVERDLAARQWSGPYPLHEVGTALLKAGYDASSVDKYLDRKHIDPPAGSAHDPLYDAVSAALAWESLAEAVR